MKKLFLLLAVALSANCFSAETDGLVTLSYKGKVLATVNETGSATVVGSKADIKEALIAEEERHNKIVNKDAYPDIVFILVKEVSRISEASK